MHAWSSHPRSDKLFLTIACPLDLLIKEGIVAIWSKRYLQWYLILGTQIFNGLQRYGPNQKLTRLFHDAWRFESIISAEHFIILKVDFMLTNGHSLWWLASTKAHLGQDILRFHTGVICKVCWSQVKIATLSFTSSVGLIFVQLEERILVLDQDWRIWIQVLPYDEGLCFQVATGLLNGSPLSNRHHRSLTIALSYRYKTRPPCIQICGKDAYIWSDTDKLIEEPSNMVLFERTLSSCSSVAGISTLFMVS